MTPRPSLPPDQLSKLLHLAATTPQSTLPNARLAQRFGIAGRTVSRLLERYGVVRPK